MTREINQADLDWIAERDAPFNEPVCPQCGGDHLFCPEPEQEEMPNA